MEIIIWAVTVFIIGVYVGLTLNEYDEEDDEI